MRVREETRAISPVVGIALMIIITLLLASVVSVGFGTYGNDLDEKKDQFDDRVSTASGNPWTGSRANLVGLSNNEAGATDVRARVNFTIRPESDTVGNSLNSIYLEVTTGSPSMFSGADQGDLIRAGVDENSDGTIDRDIASDVNGWEVQNGGSAVKIEFSGAAYTASENDSVIAVVGDVNNPTDAGSYDLRAETSGDGNWHYGTITIVE